MKSIRNIHCFLSPMLNESRVLKETNSLIKLGLVHEIKILGYWEKGLKIKEKIDENREIIRVTTFLKKLSIKILFLRKIAALIGIFQINFKFLYYIFKYKSDFISCHNLLLLPVCVLGKILTGAKLIYVPHELETEKTGLKGWVKNFSSFVERTFFDFVDKTIVVCEPIAEWYRKTYSSNQIYVLRNVPYNPFLEKSLQRSRKLRDEFQIPDNHIIFIYQGILDSARGVKEILDAFAKVNKDRHIVFMGFGDMESLITKMASDFPNIHFKAAVPIHQIIEYTSSADVGIIYLPFEVSISYKYSMPNKFFEYLMGGLSVAVSKNLEYLSNTIIENDLGWVLDYENNPFEKFINEFDMNKIKYKEISRFAGNSGWQLEDKILKQIYI
jgi:hypothetical protein